MADVMADVRDVYRRPYNPRRPRVCRDETGRQLRGDVTPPPPPAPGRPTRADSAHARGGVDNPLMLTEPWRGWRHVVGGARRTRRAFARCSKAVGDVHHPDAERIVLVMDTPNTQAPASLYAASPPAGAKRLADKLAIHCTPKHGSWRNLAAIEPGVLAGQCPARRLPDHATPAQEGAAWQADRNAATTTIMWRCTTADARSKLHHLYPPFDA